MVNVSPKAWQACSNAKMPRNYWDFGKAKKYLEKGQTPWTPAVSIFFALEIALAMMLKEGMANIFARHARVGKAARDGAKSLGLAIFADEKYASNTVTAVATPPSLDTKALLKIMREEHNVVLAGGQGLQEGKIFRIGHLGLVSEADIKVVMDALKIALPKAGFTGK
jgi:aspartate aminotransferase-like enzyme